MLYEDVNASADYIRSRTTHRPKVGIILGSGLGALTEDMSGQEYIDYADIPGFPRSDVEGHADRLVFGRSGATEVVAMQGRFHYYEGFSMKELTFPIYVLKQLGIDILIVTNACGGINESFVPGDLMLITDHIASFVPNPLIGPNADSLGVRFPDMSHIYDEELSDVIRKVSRDERIPIQEGVYIQFTGPSYESPAEVRMAGILGADAVGMSTTVEAIAANHMGMRICGISCISNPGAGLSAEPLKHEDVQAAADAAAPLFKKLLTESIIRFGRLSV